MSQPCYLYRHFDADGVLLYVGISHNIFNRLDAHTRKSHWFKDIKWVQIEKHPCRKTAMRAEGVAILNEQPKYNLTNPAVKWEKEAEKQLKKEILAHHVAEFEKFQGNNFSGKDFRRVRKIQLKATQKELADKMSVSVRTIQDIEASKEVRGIYTMVLSLIVEKASRSWPP